MDFSLANIIQRALTDTSGATHWHYMTPIVEKDLRNSGLSLTAFKNRLHQLVEEPDAAFAVWSVNDRNKAEAALLPFKKPEAPIKFVLTPNSNDRYRDHYRCPHCGAGCIKFRDGDSIGVPVLPDGIHDYNDVDTALLVGSCANCGTDYFVYEFGFTTLTDPVNDTPFCVDNIAQIPDSVELFHASAEGLASWAVSRLFFETGKLPEGRFEVSRLLPKGPFIVDVHHFGPFPLDDVSELCGRYGVARCEGGSDKWTVGERLFRNLAGNAMHEVCRQKHRYE